MSLPGDGLVASPKWASTRAITIHAAPEAVWPWVVQMGYPPHRVGWYTPHWLDRLMWGDRPRSADRVIAELQDLHVGDTVPDSADYRVFYTVVDVAPPGRLVLHSVHHVFWPFRAVNFSWSFVLLPTSAHSTRLLVRARVDYQPTWPAALVELVIGLGDLVNAGAMLSGIRDRAERTLT